MKNILIGCITVFMIVSCSSESEKDSQLESENKVLTYKNIVILSDMSSRLDNRPQKDIPEISKIVQFFKNECVKPGEKIGDRSSLSFSAITQKTAYKIDISNIVNIGKKQRFINSTGEYRNSGLNQQIGDLNNVVNEVYKTTRNQGLDLISLLIEKISNEPIIKIDSYLTDGTDTTYLKYDNHIYIFTDGYLEYIGKDMNSQFYFGVTEIEKIRKYCVNNNLAVSKVLQIDKSMGMPSSKSELNKSISLHIYETQERDKNVNTQTYKHPIGLRDNEILEAVWRKWATESGFKSFEWKKY
jgi:hypothetical protein